MDRKKLLQVLLPAGAAGGMVLLVGLLIALGDGGSTAATDKGQAAGEKPFGTPPFPLDAPEWKPVGTAGLKVWDVKEGTGEPIPEGALPIMHYTGWFTHGGAPFDTSRDDGQPLKLPLGRLISGWQIGVPGMKPGGVRRLYVPYALGYGASGGQGIPPKADLLFEMELLEWK